MNTETDTYFHNRAREAVRMCRAFSSNPRMRLVWQNRVADYRELLIDRMRKRQGWSLSERIAAHR